MRREEISLLVTHARCTAYPLSRRTDVDGRLVCARRSPQPAVVQQQQLCVDGFAALGANVIRARWFFSSLFYSNSNGPSAFLVSVRPSLGHQEKKIFFFWFVALIAAFYVYSIRTYRFTNRIYIAIVFITSY